MDTIKKRLLILSDTHGGQIIDELPSADVAIHCGDLTNGSKPEEYKAAIRLLKAIDAPLKLVIAGNHDFTLHDRAFERIMAENGYEVDSDLVTKTYGRQGEARQLLEDAESERIIFLEEGITTFFTLNNGAILNVYASLWTPGSGAWGFQYAEGEHHAFDIWNKTDIAITHGPPQGIMDLTIDQNDESKRRRAGCPELFRAIFQARPKIHCFGHVHEGWGAKLVAWRPDIEELEAPTHFNAVENDQSVLIENLARLKPSLYDDAKSLQEKLTRTEQYNQEGCCTISLCAGDENPLEKGKHTLFVNAAIEDDQGVLTQKPFLVDIELMKGTLTL